MLKKHIIIAIALQKEEIKKNESDCDTLTPPQQTEAYIQYVNEEKDGR